MISTTSPDGDCAICASGPLKAYPGFAAFRRVTSDCRPFPPGGTLLRCGACGAVQKPDDARWRRECDEIYRAYMLYAPSGGLEQQIFDERSGGMKSRSPAIIDAVAEHLPARIEAGALDYGCGRGAMIAALSEHYPDQPVDGLDTNRRFEDELSRLPGFRSLLTPDALTPDALTPDALVPGALAVTARWDLVTMIHCLEHLIDPLADLRRLATALTAGGRLLIQVPNAAANPFDILVADHRLHFTANSLRALLRRAGFRVVLLSTEIVSTELTVVAAPDATIFQPPEAAGDTDFAAGHLAWLAALRDLLEEEGGPVGVLGSSIAANWLIPHAPERVSYILDEDSNRQGGTLFGCPIIAPDQAPAGLRVVLPFATPIAVRIADRLRDLPLSFAYHQGG